MYNLTLQVADMSGDGLTATASAIITLEDVNDNAPGFTQDEVLPPCTALLAPAGDCPPFLRFLAGTRDFVEGWEVRSFAEGAQVRVVAREHINSTRSWEISPRGPLCGPWAARGSLPCTPAMWEGAVGPPLPKAAHRVPGIQLSPQRGL